MIKPNTYEPVVQSVEAVQWNALLGWEFALELAEWCGGEAVRDKNPMNTEKSYYWGILRDRNDKDRGFYAVPGDYIIKDMDGRFSILSSSDFENTFKKKIDQTEDIVRESREEGWNNAREAIRMIPCWITDKDHHGFDLWEDENGMAQESGARIEVMKILNNNPYSEDYVDPDKARAKRRITKVRRRMIEEGKDPDND